MLIPVVYVRYEVDAVVQGMLHVACYARLFQSRVRTPWKRSSLWAPAIRSADQPQALQRYGESQIGPPNCGAGNTT